MSMAFATVERVIVCAEVMLNGMVETLVASSQSPVVTLCSVTLVPSMWGNFPLKTASILVSFVW